MHLSAEIVLDFLEGRLVRDQELFWKKHLETCDGCIQDTNRWRQLRLDLKRSFLEDAPHEDLQKAMNIFPEPRSEERRGMRSILASVVFDSLIHPAFAGARGASSAARQLVM